MVPLFACERASVSKQIWDGYILFLSMIHEVEQRYLGASSNTRILGRLVMDMVICELFNSHPY